MLDEVALGKRDLTNALYQKAKADIWKHFEDILNGSVDEQEKIRKIQETLAQYKTP